MTTNLVVMETMREAVMRLRDHPCTPRRRSVADANVGFKPISELERIPVHVISVSAGLTFVSIGVHDKDRERKTLTWAGS